MPQLKLRFSGLCLHLPEQGRVDVLDAVPGANQMSRDGRERLTPHKPQLWIERTATTTTSRDEVNGSPMPLCLIESSVTSRCRDVRIYDLHRSERLRLVDAAGGALDWTRLTATRLRSLHGEVDSHQPGPAVHFDLTHGRWQEGPLIASRWTVGGNNVDLPAWHELVADFEGPIKIGSDDGNGGWRIDPVGNEVTVWVGSHPDGHHAHARRTDDYATHFKWFYEHVGLSSVPDPLEHPQLSQDLPPCEEDCGGFSGATSTAFCPDTQYP